MICFATAAGPELHFSPWVSGTRAAAYFGPVVTERLVGARALEAEVDALLEELGRRAGELGANAVVGLELDADPYTEDGRLRLRAVGTAARLEALV